MRDLRSEEQAILLEGAKKLAAMKELGLSEDQLFEILKTSGAAVGRAQQRGSSRRGQVFKPGETQLRSAAERGAAAKGKNARRTNREGAVVRDTPDFTARNVNAVVRKIQETAKQLREGGAPVMKDDFGTNELVDAGFSSTDDFDEDQTIKAGDRDYKGPEDIALMAEAEERREKRRARREGKFRARQPRFENLAGLGADELSGRVVDFAPVRSDSTNSGVRPRSPLTDAAARVDLAVAKGEITEEEGLKLSAKLQVAADPRLGAMADRRIGKATVAADSARFQTGAARQQKELNDARFIIDIQREARSRDANRESIALGHLEQANVPRSGETILYDAGFGPVEPNTTISGSNTPDSANALNAPQKGSAISWVAEQVEGPAGSFYEKSYIPPVDIQGALGAYNEKAAAIGMKKIRGQLPFQHLGIGNIRSTSDLQNAVNQMIATGVSIPRMAPDPTTGKMKATKVKDPGTQEVLDMMGLNKGEQQRLAIALNVLEQTRNTVSPTGGTVNEETVRRFSQREPLNQDLSGVTFGMRDLSGSGIQPEADIATAPPKRAAQFRGLSNESAAVPFIGQERGDPRPVRKRPGGVESSDIPSFLRAKEEAMYADKGGVREDALARNIASAQAVDEGFTRDEAIRQERATRAEVERSPFMRGRRFR